MSVQSHLKAIVVGFPLVVLVVAIAGAIVFGLPWLASNLGVPLNLFVLISFIAALALFGSWFFGTLALEEWGGGSKN